MSPTGLLSPGTSIAGYTIESLLGRGGMGSVYRARCRDRDEPVALKLISPDRGWGIDAQERFERERRLAAAVAHRGILPVYEAGEHEGRPFIAMKLAAGDLGTLLRNEGRLAPARAVSLVAQVASALDAAHAHGLVHRDVKPSNVLLGEDEGEELAYVADFGVARAAFSAGDFPGDVVGTVGYASPEQIRGEPVDQRTDVYALGCLFYECLTGRAPYARRDSLGVLWAHLHDEAPDPGLLVPDLPRGLGAVVRRALAKDPEERFPSAEEFTAAARAAVQSPRADPEAAAPKRPALPGGTVTLLAARGIPEAKRGAVEAACSAEGGMVVDARDGALLAVFADAEAAVRAAGEITAAPAPVRVGIHTGEPHPTSRGYVGTDVEQATRIADAAHRGQVVLSSSTAAHLEAAGTALRPLGSHCLTGFAPPIDLYQRGEAAFPPLKTVLTTNLPASASSFLGREEELRQADLFLQQTRLLSVTGPGGAGKTRFALELARRAREERFSDYEDGVFVCFLASLRDPDLVLPTLAQTLSVRERPGGGALEALSARLDEQRLLLLLDNIEHLLPAVSELGQLLASCPELTVLVTSRERLHLEGELVYDLPPLQPDESVALFCERAACAPSQPVEELCARLEGLPLAIELAAARMSLLSPEQLLTRLARRLDLLKASRDADPRQQTLRATIEWSYDLLAPAAQRLFARLSVFAGGCTLEAAEGVCDAELDSLESLLNKSLLRRSGERFWMLETIREYAADLLEGSSEEEELWQRHAEFFAALAERIGPDLRGRDSATLDELARDDGNFRIALQRADASGQIGVFVRLLAALAMYWFSRGPYAEVRAWLESGYQASIDDDRLAARVARGLGVVADWQGDYVLARSAFERALALARSAADRELECACLNGLGVETGYVDDDADAARKLFTECLALAIELGNEFVFAGAANNLGELELSQGRLAEAEKWLQDSLAASERLGEDRGLAMVAGSNLGLVALRTGRTEEAARRFRESLRTAEDLQQPFVQGEYASYLASVAAQRGDPVRAARLLGIAAGIVEKGGGALHPHAHALEEETRTSVRDSLGEQAAADEFAAGRALKRDEAIAYALAENEPIGATANG